MTADQQPPPPPPPAPTDADADATAAEETKPSAETLRLVEAVLDYIRGNLNNIRNALGEDSPQYKAAAEIMDKHLEENLRRLRVEKSDIADLMSDMSIKDDK